MASASERRAQRELAEARASGNAPPEVDVKTGAMINPHNPEFITKKPWYLAEGGIGGDGGPTLDHQADQRREEDKRTISLADADALVLRERERIKEKLRRQRRELDERRSRGGRRGAGHDDNDHDDGGDLFETGMWIEALRRNKRPYLIAQIVRASTDKRGEVYDLKYEDGHVERNVRPWGGNGAMGRSSTGGGPDALPRMRVTRTGSRAQAIIAGGGGGAAFVGKETYDSKRDAYHGVEIDGHTSRMEERYREREALRKEQRQKERERERRENAEREDRRRKEEEGGASARGDGRGDAVVVVDGGGDDDAAAAHSADSDSDSDSDNEGGGGGGNDDDGFSSDDEIVQRDADAKLFTSRLARQGGVGGAQMKVTARNLRIREDTAKYLRNLDPNSAYYDPKSRSMRDNPYATGDGGGGGDDGGGGDASAAARQASAAELRGFAGDNFARISGDAVGLAETQLFAWDAEKKLGVEGAVHVQADPSRAELMRRKVESRGVDMKKRKRRAVLDRYGGEEYLDASGDAGRSFDALEGSGGDVIATKETPEERATRFGVSHVEQEYGRDGRLASTTLTGGMSKQKKRVPIPCKYEEDVHINGHTAVWGSYFHKGAFRWGYSDDHSLIRSSYGTGINGRIANDESNELQHGSGMAGSAMLASARKMLEVIPRAMLNNGDQSKPHQQSKLYGEVVDQHKEFEREKLQAAMKRQRQYEEDFAITTGGKNKRKYNSSAAEVNVTEEDMEAYRLLKGRGVEDPMAMGGGDEKLLDYKK
jgi:pre-mRNA-processing factor SLU7